MNDKTLKINNEDIPACQLKMVEIYGGKDSEWKGWHNLLLLLSDEPGDHKAIAGPIDPETSLELITSIRVMSK